VVRTWEGEGRADERDPASPQNTHHEMLTWELHAELMSISGALLENPGPII
jgi:hypothetical protein